MIRIFLNRKEKEQVEDLLLADLRRAKKGPWKQLKKKVNRKFIENGYPEVAKELYDNGEVNEDNLKKLLLADRKTMKEYIKKFSPDFDWNDKNRKKVLKNDLKQWKKIFNFEAYGTRKAVRSILTTMRVDVCPYCNRIFTAVSPKSGTRPPLDHYYPKSRYPYLALTLYNLIPCCDICNRKKSKLDTAKKGNEILYPYEEEMGKDVVFRFEAEEDFVKVFQGASDKLEIKFTVEHKNKNTPKIQKQIEALSLEEIYQAHRGYVKDILRVNYIYNTKVVESIKKQFPEILKSDDDVKALMYMKRIEKEFWGTRPLAKLTHDIDEQLKELKS